MQVTASRLRRWREERDIIDFARVCPTIRFDGSRGPLELSPRQQEWLKAVAAQNPDGMPRYKTVGVVSAKRSGKTCIAAIAGLFVSVTADPASETLSVALANSRESAETLVLREMRRMVSWGPLAGSAEITSGSIRFPGTNAEVRALPCSVRTATGVNVSGLLLSDELWAAVDTEPYELLASQIIGNGQTLLVSQASGMNSPVYRLFKQHERGERKNLVVFYDSPEWLAANISPNPMLTKEFLRDREGELIPAVYRKYFLAQWGTAAERLIRPDDLQAAVLEGVPLPRTPDEVRALIGCNLSEASFASGLDSAMPGTTTGDESVFITSAFTPTGEIIPVQVERLKTGGLDEVRAATERAEWLAGGWTRKTFESYQSKHAADALGAEAVSPTAQRQHEAFTRLSRAFVSGQMRIPGEAEDLIGQLAEFPVSTETEPARYGKKVGGGRDDHVYALVWSVWGLPATGPVSERTLDSPRRKLPGFGARPDTGGLTPDERERFERYGELPSGRQPPDRGTTERVKILRARHGEPNW